MKNWKITLKFPDGTTDQLELFDGASILKGYPTIKRAYFNSLTDLLKNENNKYISGKAIEKVVGPDEADWTNNPWLLFIIRDNEKQTPFWFLFKREKKEMNGILVAIGPEQFAEYLKASSESDINLKKLLYYFTAYAKKWTMLVLLPNYLP
jgi:hypothetical protein